MKKTLLKSNLQNLQERRNPLCQNYAKECIKNGSMNDIFIENKKNHQMVTRHNEKYQVCHANTERLLKSAIPQTQKMLDQMS